MENAKDLAPGADYPRTFQEIDEWFRSDAACREYIRRLHWSDWDTLLSEIAEQGGFGRTTVTSALIQLLLDTASDSGVGERLRQKAGRQAAPLVALSQPLHLRRSHVIRSIDHAHAGSVEDVLAVASG